MLAQYDASHARDEICLREARNFRWEIRKDNRVGVMTRYDF